MGTGTRGLSRWLAAGLLVATTVGAQTPTTPVLVELFTSEGCSSCPPADDLLIDLIRMQPVRGVTIIGLSEHVDYWDHQGWKDPFSSHAFTDRQSSYAAALKVPDIYTPQIVVDGVSELIGQDRRAALDAIGRAAAAPKAPVHLLWTSGTSSLSIVAEPAAASSRGRVRLAITEDNLASNVTRGENQGRRLAHAAIVRQLAEIGRTDARGAFEKVTPVRLDPGWRRDGLGVVVFIQSDRPPLHVTAVGAITVR